jgi:hypothetical protein
MRQKQKSHPRPVHEIRELFSVESGSTGSSGVALAHHRPRTSPNFRKSRRKTCLTDQKPSTGTSLAVSRWIVLLSFLPGTTVIYIASFSALPPHPVAVPIRRDRSVKPCARDSQITNRFSCSMTSWGTRTAKLQPRCNALSAIQNPSFTRPVSACSCCCMGEKDKQNTILRPQRAEMQPSPELDRKGTRTSRID